MKKPIQDMIDDVICGFFLNKEDMARLDTLSEDHGVSKISTIRMLIKQDFDRVESTSNTDDLDCSLIITEPVGNCDGSGKYYYDSKAKDGRGARMFGRCPGCRACR